MKTCKKCNLSYDDDKKFCKKCGGSLTSEYQIDPKNVAKKTVLEDRLKADPLNIELLHEYAQFLFNNLLFKETITISFKILAINENDRGAKDLLFKSHFKLKMLKEAIEIGKQLLLERPTDVFLIEELAEISNELGNSDKAVEFYDKILYLQPVNSIALYNKALILLEKNQLEDAIEIFKKIYLGGQKDRITTIYTGIDRALNADYIAAIDILLPTLIDEKIDLKDLINNRGFLYLSYSLCQSSSDILEVLQWFSKIDFTVLKNNYHLLDEQTAVEITKFIVNHNLNKINPSTDAKNQIITLSESYLPDSYFTANSNSKIADIWYAFGKKQVELKLFADAVNSFQKANDLSPNESIYKEKYAETKKIHEDDTRKRNMKTNIIVATSIICIIIIVVLVFAYENFEEKKSYEFAKTQNSFNSYQTYIDQYPKGKYFNEAKHFQEEVFWNRTKIINTIEGYNSFIASYKNSMHINEATDKMEDALWKRSKQLNSYTNYITQFPSGKYISEIQYTEPDMNKIKNDLLDKIIYSPRNRGNWSRFDNLSKIKDLKIINKIKTSDQIEMTITMNTIVTYTFDPYYIKANVTYILNHATGWTFQNIVATEYINGW